jgi:hypothetical protein
MRTRGIARVSAGLALGLALAGGAPLGRSAVVEAAGQRTIAARPGDVASGVVVLESPRELRLRVDPCRESDVVVFYAPFTKSRLGAGTCGNGQAFDRFQVEQR